MAAYHDDVFEHDPDADLPYERDLTPWLEGDSLDTVEWFIDDPALLEQHDDAVVSGIVRVWLRGTGLTGVTYVRCRFTSDDGRRDERSWKMMVVNR